MRAYSARLAARLPKTAAGGASGTPTLATQDWHVRLGDGDVAAACAVVTTCEYCTEAIGALGRSVAKLLDPPLGEQVGETKTQKKKTPKAKDGESPCILRVMHVSR